MNLKRWSWWVASESDIHGALSRANWCRRNGISGRFRVFAIYFYLYIFILSCVLNSNLEHRGGQAILRRPATVTPVLDSASHLGFMLIMTQGSKNPHRRYPFDIFAGGCYFSKLEISRFSLLFPRRIQIVRVQCKLRPVESANNRQWDITVSESFYTSSIFHYSYRREWQ